MSRLSLLSTAFRDVPLTIGSHTLRPVTAGTVMLLMDIGNALFADDVADGEDGPSEASFMRALFEFIWLHVGPEDEIVSQVDDPAVFRAAARKFSLGISFEALDAFSTQFAALRERINASQVDAIPESGEKKSGGETPPPTGSPLTSTTSAVPETPPANTTSSGDYPSTVGSNTSTPHTPTTAPAPAGPSRIWEEAPAPPQSEDPVIPIG